MFAIMDVSVPLEPGTGLPTRYLCDVDRSGYALLGWREPVLGYSPSKPDFPGLLTGDTCQPAPSSWPPEFGMSPAQALGLISKRHQMITFNQPGPALFK